MFGASVLNFYPKVDQYEHMARFNWRLCQFEGLSFFIFGVFKRPPVWRSRGAFNGMASRIWRYKDSNWFIRIGKFTLFAKIRLGTFDGPFVSAGSDESLWP